MGLTPTFITARDLPDAWFQAVDNCITHGRQWTVESGSYDGQKRWELDHVTIHIMYPGTRPLVPEMPVHLAHIPPPTTMEYVEEYLPYLMEDMPLKENESYTYASRIASRIYESHYPDGEPYGSSMNSQIDQVIRKYKHHGHGTNQCSMSIAQPEDIHLSDPPCLREIDCRIVAPDGLKDGEEPALHFVIYFRSWDLWGGFPANLAAVRLLQEYMAEEIGVEAGEMICSSKGLHIYDHVWSIAQLRVGK